MAFLLTWRLLVEWMLAEATRHTVGWQSAGLTVVPLGIKVSSASDGPSNSGGERWP
jgi:hypothetical protein